MFIVYMYICSVLFIVADCTIYLIFLLLIVLIIVIDVITIGYYHQYHIISIDIALCFFLLLLYIFLCTSASFWYSSPTLNCTSRRLHQSLRP